ncbi:MAG: AAA family ATPase [Bacteroidaceae bacterium]|nr:AAA family ATPase [Bacteroidaceae bacterium]
MRYTKFVIENFKGIHDLTIDLSKQPESRIFTFIGLNESGKTTILEAINVFSTGYRVKDFHKLIPKHLKANFNGEVSVSAYVDVDDEDNRRIKDKFVELGYTEYVPVSSFSIDTTYCFENSKYKRGVSYWGFSPKVRKKQSRKFIELPAEHSDWQTVVTYIENNLMPRIVYYENFLFDFPERIYLSGKQSDNMPNKLYKDIIEDIVEEIIPGGSVQTSLVDNYLDKDSGSQDVFDAIQSKLQDKIGNEVFSSWGRLFNTTETYTSVALRFGVETNDREQDFYVEIKIKENSDLYYISERSLGFRWFFSFLFFILFRKNRKTDLGETLFLLDEPASNLHSAAQKKLLETFERFVDDKDKPLKLLYTTHSHYMINPKWLEGAFVVKNEAINYLEPFSNSSTTDIKAIPYKNFVANYPNQQDYYQPVLDALDYQPGLLEKVPNIIITEGKNDFYTLCYINEVLLNNKYKKINLMPGAGCNKNGTVIQLYMAWNKAFIILLDGDKAGERSKADYIKEFGEPIRERIKVYNDFVPAIGNSMMEDIFTEEEKLCITQRFDNTATKYNKSAFNTAIQSALINKEMITLSKDTIDKFDKLLAELNKYKF